MASLSMVSAVGGDGGASADVEKIGDGFDPGVVDEAAGAGANVVALGRGGLHGVRRQQARHAEERLAEAIADDALVVGKDQRLALAGVDVKIEQKAAAVMGRETLEAVGGRLRIAIGWMAVRH